MCQFETMRKILSLFLFAFIACFFGHAQLNLSVAGQLDYQSLHNSDLSDVWGYTDELGNEYAIVGVNTGGTSIVDVTDPSSPIEVFFTSGPNTIWRDMKTWGDYAYITNESSGGLKIIDMSGLPGNTNLPVASYNGNGTWSSAHNLFIDEFGFCYIAGANRGNGGVIFLDLTDPMAPVEVGEYDQFYVHDVMVKDNQMFLSHISNGFFQLLNVTDKSAPVIMGSQETSSTFTHNAWVSDDLKYLYTTDEVPSAFIDSYDISDPSDIVMVDQVQSNPGSNVIVHNTHFLNDYLITSYYRDGVTIHDVAFPDNVIEVGNYDTSPFQGNGFNGCWGVFPWLPSGNILATDIEEGLIILAPNYQRGCYLTGTVTDASTTFPIFDAEVELIATPVLELTALNGAYATGIAQAGTYDLEVSKPGFVTELISGVELSNGNSVVVDVELTPLVSISINGQTFEMGLAEGLGQTEVMIVNDDFVYEATSDGSGNFSFDNFFPGTYDIYAGQWGYITTCITNVFIDPTSSPLEIELELGIYDDFTFDFGWTNTATSPTGNWERGEPYGTISFMQPSNPEFDVDGDCFDQCYVTGNNNVDNAGNDDVDDGEVVLISPVFDGNAFNSPLLNFWRWFANYDNTIANDQLDLLIDNGITQETLASYNDQTEMSEWVFEEFILENFIEVTSTMQLVVRTADDSSNGSIVEAGIDLFSVVEGLPIGIGKNELDLVEIYPNPTSGSIRVDLQNGSYYSLEIFTMDGKSVFEQNINASGQIDLNLAKGIYMVRIGSENELFVTKKLIIQ